MNPPTPVDPASQAPDASQHDLLDRATSHHQAGRLAQARALYEEVLRSHPDNPIANHNLGALFMQSGMPVATALPHFRAAWEADPSHFAHGLSYLRALVVSGDLAQARRLHAEGASRGLRWPAIASFQQSPAPVPGAQSRTPPAGSAAPGKLTQAQFKELAELFARGDYAAIEARARALVRQCPDDGIAWKALGSAAARLGRTDEAIASLRTAARLLPGDAETHGSLGHLLRDAGLLAEAESAFRRLCTLQPDRPDPFAHAGDVLWRLNRFADAEAAFRRAVSLRNDFPDALCGLARTLASTARAQEAESLFNRTLALRPDHRAAIAGLGGLLYEQRRLDEAEALCRRALAIAPDDAQMHYDLGTVLTGLARFDDAEASYRKAVELRPEHLPSRSSLLFVMNYNVRESPSRLFEEARAFGESARRQARAPYRSWRCEEKPDRLRVGLVSGDLRNHPVGYAIEGMLAASTSSRIDWIGYPTFGEADDLTSRLKAACAGWKSLVGLDDGAAAAAIHDDAISVLVDLSGHTVNNRLPVFAWRPAPVQATWLGYFATTGLDEMDYVLVDPVSATARMAPWFTERLWYLPHTRLCFTPPDTPLAPSQLPALANGYVTYGCFQGAKKLTDESLETWGEILRLAAGSRLLLRNESLSRPQFARQLEDRLARAGVDRGRVELGGAVPRAEYFAAFSRVDVMLDTFPYPGATTTCEALWMGVPTVTLAGDTMAERQGASLLAASGFPEWVAETREDYVRKALSLTADLPRLAALRNGMRERARASPVFDAARFARDLESALWGMWSAHASRDDGAPRS